MTEAITVNIFDLDMAQKEATGRNPPHWLSPLASQKHRDRSKKLRDDSAKVKITFTDTSADEDKE